MLISKTLRLFLESIGRRDEYEFYLNKFQSDEAACFGILCPDAECIEQSGKVLIFDLEFLLRLDLSPVVLLCGPDTLLMKERLLAMDHDFHVQALDPVMAFQPSRINLIEAPDDDYASALLKLVPDVARRVHFLRVRGGFSQGDGQAIQSFYTYRPNTASIGESDQVYLEHARKVLEAHPRTHVSLSSPLNLLKELFTVRGAGTILRRGSVINRPKAAAVDQHRLLELFESAFKKNLHSSDVLASTNTYYIEENYRGAALLEQHEAGAYLSKFAVGTQARGEGLAAELWQEVVGDHPAMFWRSREDNPVNHWYDKQADGRFTSTGWNVYWRGIEAKRVTEIIEYCIGKETDFQEG